MPCANKLASAKEPVSDFVRQKYPQPLLDHRNPEDGVILSLAYHPGFTPDLTSWIIQINEIGELQQAVHWYRHSNREEELMETAEVDEDHLLQLSRLLDRADSDSCRSLESAICIDDAAMVSIFAPQRDLRVDLPYFHMAHDIKKGRQRLSDDESRVFQAFASIWKFADGCAPYNLRQHQKGANKTLDTKT